MKLLAYKVAYHLQTDLYDTPTR